MKTDTRQTALWALWGLTAIVAAGISAALYSRTLAAMWQVCATAIATGIVSAAVMWRLWQGVTGSSRVLPNFICHTAAATFISGAALLGINYMWRDTGSAHTEKVVVQRVYSETRHRTERVGRRYRRTGEPYKVYYMDVRFASGHTKSIPLTAGSFRRRHVGDTLQMDVERGALGMNVFTPRSRNATSPASECK